MPEILLDLATIIVLFFILKFIFRRRISPYDTKFWSIVQTLWLVSSFAGVSFGLYEIQRVRAQSTYLEAEEKLIEEFDSVKISIYGFTEEMHTDSLYKPNVRESVQWFYRMASLLEESYTGSKWKSFANYTRWFVFNDPGVKHQPKEDALFFDWPKDPSLDPADVVYKQEIRRTINSLTKLQADIDGLAKLKPRDKPEFLARYLFVIFFTIAFPLKLLRTYAESLK